MELKRFLRTGLAATALTLTMAAIAYTASAPTGPTITVYRSPT